jgi:putative inorganic carbon (HCO3(-)) transporter
MGQAPPRTAHALRFCAVAVLGVAFSLALYQVWELELRWLGATVVGVAGIGLAMCFAEVFSDFMLIVFMFTLPLVSFSKWFWPGYLDESERGNLIYSGAIGIGLLDFILVALYLSWFYRIFVIRSEPLPKLNLLDLFVVWFLVANLIATIGSPRPTYGLGVVEFLLKYALLYFYVSRNLRARHLPWALGAFAFAIVLEAGLGVYQVATGKLLGIALDKGAGGETLSYQYSVPGTEGSNRATGTCYDSHSLGHFIAMMLPFPLILCFTPWVRRGFKLLFGSIAGLAFLVVYMSLSRSAWLAIAIALPIGLLLILIIWRERQVIPTLATGVLLFVLIAPFAASYIYDRFVNSPYEVLTTRFDQYEVGLHVWSKYLLFGYGPGNWTEALHRFDYLWLEVLPIHNIALWTATESGIVGLVGFFGIAITALWRLFALVRARRDLAARMAMAAFCAIIISLLTGLTDPTLREPNTFTMYWLAIALSVALPALPEGTGAFLLAPRPTVHLPIFEKGIQHGP